MSDAPRHFISEMIEADIAAGTWGPPGDGSVVRTRFPPEPNGYLHVGHAKAISLSFGLAERYGGQCNLRFDDTNPLKENEEYVRSITHDVRWLGFSWPGAREDDPLAGVLFASDYFQQLFDWAIELIEKGLAYVDEQDADTIRRNRGTPTEPGTPSPFRDRPAAESVDIFRRMAKGEFPDGSRVLRAKIDMASPNFNLRDPVMYRILHAKHHRTGDRWCIYPMYDWAHGQEDAIEGVTASLCTLEFEIHRPLYEWFLAAINKDRGPGSKWGEKIHEPRQTEFSRLNPTYVITSKRKLLQLVEEGHVSGWDDPRMPTISGLRRRGYTPESLRDFCDETGVTKFKASHDFSLLERAIREHLNKVAPRRMAVLDPLKVVITNWADGGDANRTEQMDAINNPEDDSAGMRQVPFTRELYIERADFMEDAPRKFFRLKPGGEVRLRYGYWVTCNEVIKNDAGEVVELRCTYDPATKGGDNPPPDADGKVRKVKGTLHWVSAEHAVEAEVRLFDRLFNAEVPDRAPKNADERWSFLESLNPDSLRIVTAAKLEPALAEDARELVRSGRCFASLGDASGRFQFERQGYFCLDPDSSEDALVFNRIVTLRDSWAKQAGKGG